VFDATFAHEFCSSPLDPTVIASCAGCNTYRIPLAKAWKVLRVGEGVSVIARGGRVRLPVDVDRQKMEKKRVRQLVLLHGLTESLDAGAARHHEEARVQATSALPHAAKDLRERTSRSSWQKWLVTQTRMEHVDPRRIHVVLADEVIPETLDRTCFR
jgi:hypothetical protein